jgi:undecaprenyl-diphosphatase
MEIRQAIVLALIQGITEFLPISSTAHLILIPYLTDWPDQGLAFDVALNTATWLALVVYFRKDILGLARGFFKSILGRRGRGGPEARLAWQALVATIPVGIAGILAHDLVATGLRNLWVIGASSIAWGIVLWMADRRPGSGDEKSLGWGSAIFIGIAQAVSLIPGTSRSGITMTAGLFAGLKRESSARFSFLLAMVVGALAGGKEGLDMIKAGRDTPWSSVGVGFIVAFISAYLVIHYFLKFIQKTSMKPYVAYRVLLGVALLWYAMKVI